MVASGVTPTLGQGLELLLREAGGGLLFGLMLGLVVFRMLKSVDNYQVEVLLVVFSASLLIAVGLAVAVFSILVQGLSIGQVARTADRQARSRAK